MSRNPRCALVRAVLALAVSVALTACVVDEPHRPGVDYGYVGGGFSSGYSPPYDDGSDYGPYYNGGPYYYGGPYYGSAYAYPYS